MKGLLFLLCCIEILGALLCGANISSPPNPSNASDLNSPSDSDNSSIPTSITPLPATSVGTSPPSKLMSTQSSKTSYRDSKSPPSTPQPGPKSATISDLFFKEEFLSLLMVTGGLLITCTILLLATLLLSCKVCRLSRRIKVLSSNSDMNSNSEYWMGSAKKDKTKPEEEPRETTVLMADVNQTQEEVGNGAAKEEGEKVNADEQMEEEEKKKKEEEGDAAKTEEASAAPVAAAENSSPPKQQEEATDSQPDNAAAASTSEGTEEAKDVV